MSHAPGAVLKPLVALGKSPEDCWQWLGAVGVNGYPKKEFAGESIMAHRWIWQQLFGPVPSGMVVNRTCQNVGCVNPHHLRVVSQADSIRDGLGTTLTARDVADIRRLNLADWTHRQIGEKFGVAESTVGSIVNGKAWRRARKFYGAATKSRSLKSHRSTPCHASTS